MNIIVRVALPLPRPKLFDYLAGPDTKPAIGRCVRLPFGAGEKTGVIVALSPADSLPAERLKPVIDCLDVPLLPESWMALTAFAARYYQYPLGEVISAALPPGIRRAVKLPRDHDPWLTTTASGRTALGESTKLTRALAAVLAVQSAGARRRSQLLGDLEGDASSAIREARHKGWLETVSRAGEREPIGALPLNPSQATAVDRISASLGQFGAFLLFGVTGSGKTEVYLHLIAHALASGRQALMLVPEIGLTPQLLERVANRFPGANLVVLHSGLADGARSLGFVQALRGEADIVLGTRLSVFVPLPRLGLIVVDEEHDASFKQQEGLRYSARDLAVWRAHHEKLPIVLGSATPSLETWMHAEDGRYIRLDLPQPAVAEHPPALQRIDTRRIKLDDGLSPALVKAIRVRLERHEQSLIFLNRRGYAPVIACNQCGWVSTCPNCSANQVFHAADARLRCHHCGWESPVPKACPDCGNQDLHAFGRGTQRIEERLQEYFPDACVERVDRDSVRTPTQWEEVRARIERCEIDILVGTQMLAKGHDFPNLTLVGIVGADTGLYSADYRAPERLFQQLMQVSGRSGRGELPGEVLVQTEFPEHPLYEYLARRDYPGFARRELEDRQQAGFPPYSYHAVLRAEAPELEQAIAFLESAQQHASALQSPVRLYDVIPMRLVRRARMERAQLVIECDSRAALQAMLTMWLPIVYEMKTPRDLRWHLDVDPGEL